MHELAKTNKYYRICNKGNFVGICHAKMIGIILRLGRVNPNSIVNYSYRESNINEYVTFNKGYGLLN